jgi:magnesium transporter
MSLYTNKIIKKLENHLGSLSGFEIAKLLVHKKGDEQLRLFSLLTPDRAAETFDYLSLSAQKNLLRKLQPEQIAGMLYEMPDDDRTALLNELPKATAASYIKLLPEEDRAITIKLLGYPEEFVGHYMTTDYIAVTMDQTIEQVLDHIRAYGHDSETIDVIYVIDDHGILIDDFRMKQLFFVPKDRKVFQIADGKFLALSATSDAKQAINLFKEHDRLALPVIDETGMLLGIVTIDDILRLSAEAATEEIQKVGGTEALDDPYMEAPFLQLMKKRGHWLILLFIGEMFTATAMGHFEDEIAQAVVLALFLPLIISSGGNAGSQSSTLIIRAMALGEVKIHDWWKVMRREICSGLFLGIILGIIGFFRVALWSMATNNYGEHWILIGITIALSLMGVVLWGALSGSMLPIALKRFNIDPAVASAPLVATLVDVTGISLYFSIAMWVLKGSLL